MAAIGFCFVVGATGLVLVCAATVACRLLPERRKSWLPGLLLCYLVVLDAVLTAAGRTNLGLHAALANRYITMSSLLWIGLLPPALTLPWGRWMSHQSSRLATSAGVLFLAGAYASSYASGAYGLMVHGREMVIAQSAVLDYRNAPAADLALAYPPDPDLPRRTAPALEALNLGPFAGGSRGPTPALTGEGSGQSPPTEHGST